jgi:hypothetical protein
MRYNLSKVLIVLLVLFWLGGGGDIHAGPLAVPSHERVTTLLGFLICGIHEGSSTSIREPSFRFPELSQPI